MAASLAVAASIAPAEVRAADGEWVFNGTVQGAGYTRMAYDSARNRLLGFDSHYNPFEHTYYVTTYALSFGPPVTYDTLATIGSPPTATWGAPTVYDSARDRLLVHDGSSVFQLELGLPVPHWSIVSVAGASPPVRTEHAGIYDPVGDRLIVFGGLGNSPDPFSGRWNDVWALNLDDSPAWSEITPATSAYPGGVANHAALYDPVRQRMVVYGGSTQSGGPTSVQDIGNVAALTLDGSPSWMLLSTSGFQCSDPGVTYDPFRDRLVAFGGRNRNVGYVYDHFAAFSFVGGIWRTLAPTGDSPAARFGHGMGWSPDLDEMVMYGVGYDVWLYDPSQALAVPPAGTLAFGLRAVAPITREAFVELECTLPNAEDATVELFDVAGRNLATRRLSPAPTGTSRIRLVPSSTAPGITFARLTQGARVAQAKSIRLR